MAAFTKLGIMRVFENLLSVKPLEKITVKDITDQCGISRNTFYYHYQDIYQVFKAYIDYSLEEIFKFLQQENEKDQDHICEKAVEFLENHRTIFENILRKKAISKFWIKYKTWLLLLSDRIAVGIVAIF